MQEGYMVVVMKSHFRQHNTEGIPALFGQKKNTI